MSATTQAGAQTAPDARYAATMRVLHWLTALLILGMFILGLAIRYGDPKPDSLAHTLYNLHESTGVTIWVLTLIRVVVRLTTGAPSLPVDTPQAVRVLAAANQLGLYVLLLLMPILGFIDTNAWGSPLVWYEAVPIPSPVSKLPDAVAQQWSNAHWWGALILFVLLVLHISGALYHAVVRRDRVIRHMI